MSAGRAGERSGDWVDRARARRKSSLGVQSVAPPRGAPHPAVQRRGEGRRTTHTGAHAATLAASAAPGRGALHCEVWRPGVRRHTKGSFLELVS